ncbi:MAG TPA: MMPL family transporter [Thermomicrobiales bacterium]|nr:MMPL family transporter [Thermomicrobiales bacterium]
MRSLTRFVLDHRLLVVLTWVVIAVAGGALAGRTTDSLSYDFGLPGQDAYEANQAILSTFGAGGVNDPVVLTIPAPAGTDLRDPAALGEFAVGANAIAAVFPGTLVITPDQPGAGSLIAPDGSRAAALLYPPVIPGPEPYGAALPAIEGAAHGTTILGQAPELTGTALLIEGGGGGERSILVELALGGGGALIVLVAVFGSLLAVVPLLVATVSILATYLALLGLAQLTDVVFVIQYLVALIGLGVAIDYSLLIVMRWREERARGLDNDAAVRVAMATAGRAVIFSGITVAVSLAALLAVPIPFLRSIGLGGLLIPLLSVLTALTLVPVILRAVGPRLEWPRKQPRDPASAGWRRVATAVVRRPWPVIAGTLVLLLLMAAPVVTLRLGTPDATTYGAGSAPGAAAAAIRDSGLPSGLLRPTQLLVPGTGADATAGTLAGVEGVAGATTAGWSSAGSEVVLVWPVADAATQDGRDTLNRVTDTAPDDARVGGSPAEDVAFVDAAYGSAPVVLLLIILITFILLAWALRSFWLPVKALALNAVSLAAAYGLTVLIWQDGIGTDLVYGIGATGTIVTWIPIAVFAFLFGLSMDYEVFILSRMREAFDQHGDTPRAVVDGIAYTGRLVTSAALILFLAFVALSTVPVVDVKILATALALGILIDAVIVRALLAPALVVVLGRANWTLPGWLARLLRIDPDVPAPRH